MSLVIEDGTGKSDANSYIGIDEAKVYAALRGVDLGTDETITSNLVLAADYMETTGPYSGERATDEQRLEFPRKNMVINGKTYTGDPIPQRLKDAQAQLLLDIKESGPLQTSNQQYALKRKKIEGLEWEYATGSYAQVTVAAKHPTYDNLMSWFKSYGAGGRYTVIR